MLTSRVYKSRSVVCSKLPAVVIALTACTTLTFSPTFADDAENTKDEQAQAVHRWTGLVAGEIELRVEDDDSLLQATAGPILKWSNPAAGRIYGDVYLWPREGRPVAVVSLYEWFAPFTSKQAELLSLTESPLAAQLNGATIWKPTASDLSWSTLKSEAPAPSSPVRRIQLRRVAKRFAVTMVDKRSNKQGVVRPLRLLKRPVHVYADRDEGVLDGAVFAFVMGTDPDAFLLIEAREKGGLRSWAFLVGRMNDAELVFTHDGRKIRRFARLPRAERWNRRKPYALVALRGVLDPTAGEGGAPR